MPAGNELCRSIEQPEQGPVEAKCTIGKIPQWVNGTLYRNGPGRYEYKNNREYDHLFDGHACVHKYKIENGSVKYSTKLLDTNSYKAAVEENRLYAVFGTPDLCSTAFGRLKTLFTHEKGSTTDNTNVNVCPYGKVYFLDEF
jgi:beta,beta-carotene 9',10'-dioxygenase